MKRRTTARARTSAIKGTSKVEIMYLCRFCGTPYRDKKHADACHQPPMGRFQVGDVLYDNASHPLWGPMVVASKPTIYGAHLVRSSHYIKASGEHDVQTGKRFVRASSSFWCHARPFRLDSAKTLALNKREELFDASTFLAMVEATHARHKAAR